MLINEIERQMIKLIALLGVVFCLAVLLPGPAAALDWFKAGKDLLQSTTGGQTPGLDSLTDSEIGAEWSDRIGARTVARTPQ